MSPDHARALYERYPAIFAQRGLSLKVSLMSFGFSCGDGWFEIIDDLCARLQAGVDCGDFDQVEAHQVKEKYAELRFYYGPNSEAADALVEAAEDRSRKTCETCGAPGVLREKAYWYRTRCDEHAEAGSVVVPEES